MILVDSDILIAQLRGVPAAKEWLARALHQSGPLTTSAIAIAEVAGGMRSPERFHVRRLLSSLHIYPAGERTAWRAAEFMRTYRRSHPR
ncbi:MAG: PIN domain-containing protein, partial [Chloroflexi bacterium]|nr:PIN domain-containing protein [Chloroflexota bacterium]